MISVCIPTYNGGKYIKEQLDSILCQLSENDEIIISDDRSTDNTISIIQSYNDNRIKLFIHEKIENLNKGPYRNIYNVYKNVENALMHAFGDYIFLSDQDDIWLPNKVEVVMAEFENNGEIVLHNNTVVDNDHNVLLESYFTFSRPYNSSIRMLLRCFIQGASLAFTKRIKDHSLPFPLKPVSHDHWIAYNAFFRGHKIRIVKESLMLYRRHDNNVSSSSEKSKNPLWFRIHYRFRLLNSYIKIRIKK